LYWRTRGGVSVGLWIEPDSLVVVLYGPFVISQVDAGVGPVEIHPRKLRIDADGFVLVYDGTLVLAWS
jgi:hypothetical protein